MLTLNPGFFPGSYGRSSGTKNDASSLMNKQKVENILLLLLHIFHNQSSHTLSVIFNIYLNILMMLNKI